jgi:hypothetical protein
VCARFSFRYYEARDLVKAIQEAFEPAKEASRQERSSTSGAIPYYSPTFIELGAWAT